MSKAEWSLLSITPLTQNETFAQQPHCYICGLFYLRFHCVDGLQVFIPSPAEWQPHCFWCGPATNKTAVGIHGCLFVQIHVQFPRQTGFLGHGECVFYCKSHQLFTKRPHHCAASTIWAFPLLLICNVFLLSFVCWLLILTVLGGMGCAVAGMRVAPTGSYVSIPGPQLVWLFGKD